MYNGSDKWANLEPSGGEKEGGKNQRHMGICHVFGAPFNFCPFKVTKAEGHTSRRTNVVHVQFSKKKKKSF